MPIVHAIPYPDIDPVFLRLGPLQFRWYGLMYLISLTLAYFIILARAKAKQLPLDRDQVYDMIVYAAIGVFAGGRLGYVLFYNLGHYVSHPLVYVKAFGIDLPIPSVLAVWEGGMSFHGGLIGTIIALILFAKRKGIPVYTIADLAAGVTPVGLGLGRIGNFINGELFGRPTDVDWCMVFPAGGPVCRHPSQLYEAALEGLLLFTLLWLISRTTHPPGTVFWSFLAGYGVCRFIVEYFREPDTQMGFLFGSFSMGQMLSFPMILVGIVMLTVGYQRRPSAAGP